MPKVLLLAILLSGCTGFKMYNEYSKDHYDNYKDNEPFPKLTIKKEEDRAMLFTVHRENDDGLLFHPLDALHKARFSSEEGDVFLDSVEFVFSLDNYIDRLIITFKAVSTDDEWRVTSQVFTPPEEESIKMDAAENAVSMGSAMANVAKSLSRQTGRRHRTTSFEIKLILDLLTHKLPKRVPIPENDTMKLFFGAPVIVVTDVLDKLNLVRGYMENFTN